jgi:hypothetical protein
VVEVSLEVSPSEALETHAVSGNVNSFFIAFAQAKGVASGFQTTRSGMVRFPQTPEYTTHKRRSEIYPSTAYRVTL